MSFKTEFKQKAKVRSKVGRVQVGDILSEVRNKIDSKPNAS